MTLAPPNPTTLGELRASGYAPRSAERRRSGRTCCERLRGREVDLSEGVLRLRRHRGAGGRERAALRSRPHLPRGARSGEDADDPGSSSGLLDAWIPSRWRAAALHDDPVRSDHAPSGARRVEDARATTCTDRVGARGRSATSRSWRRRTCRSADLIGDVDPVKVAEGPVALRRAHDPLRPGAANPSRDLLHQRAARPHGEGAGGPVQRDGGAGRPDQGLPRATSDRRAGRGEREPGGLHQPRSHHHAAQGPLCGAGPHPLSADPRSRARRSCAGRRPRCRPASKGSTLDVPAFMEDVVAELTLPGAELEPGREPGLRSLRTHGHRQLRDPGRERSCAAPCAAGESEAVPRDVGPRRRWSPRPTGKIELEYCGRASRARPRSCPEPDPTRGAQSSSTSAAPWLELASPRCSRPSTTGWAGRGVGRHAGSPEVLSRDSSSCPASGTPPRALAGVETRRPGVASAVEFLLEGLHLCRTSSTRALQHERAARYGVG